ncbi:hypothetical protein [Virgibacillus salexigens]|uniref:Uncharacterized protein n=1 Tax=Virgibacillus massiliensis TaxID=1462526 RepID=A0A024QH99_9BACI|nr:hypothetical protein [Virgibacillus massiliensis]CDQ41874.1 hypothetical protein BN990_04253 [Virgibacillus massiliensis]
MNFKLDTFIDRLDQKESLPFDQVKMHERLILIDEHIDNHEVITEDFLDFFTAEELEWYYNFIEYWPSIEAEIEPEDYDHEMMQYSQTIELINEISDMKGIQKEVTFI